jgi:hypothetical protein
VVLAAFSAGRESAATTDAQLRAREDSNLRPTA